MKILTVVGARPQFIKAAMVSREIHRQNQLELKQTVVEEILHTGQHYDQNMSDVFFQDLRIPMPAVNLHIGSGLHGEVTAKMLTQIEAEIVQRTPDLVLVYGDTNSTLAGALAAAKLHVPVAHVEAGLRSFNRRMPEEVNRVLTDHISKWLFCPTHTSVKNLAAEGICAGVRHVGDVMYDAALAFADIAARESRILAELHLMSKRYLLATVHRAENTDDPVRLTSIVRAMEGLAKQEPVVFPVHPRTRGKLQELNLLEGLRADRAGKSLLLIDPVSFLDMVQLEKHARVILTDSGGVQKESYFHQVPCVTLRDETEWTETVEAGWNTIVGADEGKIARAVGSASCGVPIPEYGQGNSAEHIIGALLAHERSPIA